MASDDLQDEGVQRPFDVTVLDGEGDVAWHGEMDAMDSAAAESMAKSRFDAVILGGGKVRVEAR